MVNVAGAHLGGQLLPRSTTVFRKSTHTNNYLDFQSHHPLAHKVAVACTLFDHAEKICSDFLDLEKEKEHVAKGAPEQQLPQKACTDELASTTLLTTAQAGHTHSHSHPSVHPSPIKDHPKDIGPTQDSHMLPATSHTSTIIGETEEPHAPTTTSRCVYQIPCGSCSKVYINWTNGQDSGTLLEGAQKGIDIREPSPVSGSRACS